MAETIGLFAGIIDISKLASLVWKFVVSCKNYNELLEALHSRLRGIEYASGMVRHVVGFSEGGTRAHSHLGEASASQGRSPHLLDAKMNALVTQCSNEFEGLIVRLKKALEVKSPGEQRSGLIWTAEFHIKKALRVFELSLKEPQLRDLISATESMESSLQCILTGLLLNRHEIQPSKHENTLEEIKEKLEEQSEILRRSEKRLDSDSYQVSTSTNEQTIPTGTHATKKGKSFGKRLHPKSRSSALSPKRRGQTALENQISRDDCKHGQGQDSVDHRISLTRPKEGEDNQDSSDYEAVLVTSNDDPGNQIPHRAAMIPDSFTIPEGFGSRPPSIEESSTRSFTTDDSDLWPDPDNADEEREPYDSEHMDVEPEAQIFIDTNIDLSLCLRSDTEVWKFCTKTLLLCEDGKTTFALQNPCETYCEHISIQVGSAGCLDRLEMPQTIDVSLCDTPEAGPSSATADQPPFRFILVPSSRSNDLRTSIAPSHNRMEWVYGPYELFMTADTVQSGTEVPDETETDSDGEATSEPQEHAPESDKNGEEEEEKENPDSAAGRHRLGPFSSIPCFFCQQDALNPQWSGAGRAGFLVGSNASLRITCERCKDSTWISAMTWGPSFPGGSWCMQG